MRWIALSALPVAVSASTASADTVTGSYTALAFWAAGDDPLVAYAEKTAYRWGSFSHGDDYGASLVCRGWCYGSWDDVLSVAGFGDVAVDVVRTGVAPIGVSVRWTNRQYSLACFGSNDETRSSRTCVKRVNERVTKDTFYPADTEHIDGAVSVVGCGFGRQRAMTAGDAHRSRTAADASVVSRYVARASDPPRPRAPFRSICHGTVS
jgi:hypothetical protein